MYKTTSVSLQFYIANPQENTFVNCALIKRFRNIPISLIKFPKQSLIIVPKMNFQVREKRTIPTDVVSPFDFVYFVWFCESVILPCDFLVAVFRESQFIV